MATSFKIESTVCGQHVYKAAWSPYIGEKLPVQCEVNNIHDDFTIAILKNSNTVGLLVLPAEEWQRDDLYRLMLKGKDSWFRVCTSSEGNKNTLRDR